MNKSFYAVLLLCFFANCAGDAVFATDLVPGMPESMAGSYTEWQAYQQILRNEEEKARREAETASSQKEAVRQQGVSADTAASEAKTAMQRAEASRDKVMAELKESGLTEEQINENEDFKAVQEAYNSSVADYTQKAAYADAVQKQYTEILRKEHEEQQRLLQTRNEYEVILDYLKEIDTYAYDKNTDAVSSLRAELLDMKQQCEDYSRFMLAYEKSQQSGAVPDTLKTPYAFYTERMEAVATRLSEINPKTDIGDPVLLASGQYFLEDMDFSVQYGISSFDLYRSFLSGGTSKGVLGNGWQSALDTCIVRGTGSSVFKEYTEVSAAIERIKSVMTKTENYEYEAIAANDLRKTCQTKIQVLSERKRMLLDIMNREHLSERYNAYANNETLALVRGLSTNAILYISETGSYEFFIYDEARNLYAPVEAGARSFPYIAVGADDNESFTVYERNGDRKVFNAYGKPVFFENVYGSRLDFVYDESDRHLQSVEHNGRMLLSFMWNDQGLVTRITDMQTENYILYEYADDYLTAITNQSGARNCFVYDSDGDITKIIKADGSSCVIQYGSSSTEKYKHVIATKNEEGFEEYFTYSKADGKMVYVDADGQEFVYLIRNGNQIVSEYLNGTLVISRAYDSEGRIGRFEDRFGVRNYSYDTEGQICSVLYDDGTAEKYTYDTKYGNIETFTDRDGIVTRFEYNEFGTCTAIYMGDIILTKITVNSWGGVETSMENGVVQDYSYNDSYQIIRKGNVSYTYDSFGFISEISSGSGATWFYENSTDGNAISMRNPRGLRIDILKNIRGDIEQIVETDTLSGATCVRMYEYDLCHVIHSVWYGFGMSKNDAIQSLQKRESFEYSPAGRLLSYTRWNYGAAAQNDAPGIRNEYVYGNGDEVVRYTRLFVDYSGCPISDGVSWEYQTDYAKGLKVVSFFAENEFVCRAYVDFYGNIIRSVDAEGRIREELYSPAGRMLRLANPKGGIYTYDYDTCTGLLTGVRDNQNWLERISYDAFGLVCKTEFLDGYAVSYARECIDGFGIHTEQDAKRTSVSVVDQFENVVQNRIYDRNGSTINSETYAYNITDNSVTRSGSESPVRLDAWGNPIFSESLGMESLYDADGHCLFVRSCDGAGNERTVYYSYNSFGKISQKTDSSGCTESYCYDEMGNLVRIIDEGGAVWQGAYDIYGNLIYEKGNSVPEREYTYDGSGNMISIKESGIPVFSRGNSFDMRTIRTYDAYENMSSYEYDEYGNLLRETDSLGNITTYLYNKANNSVLMRDGLGSEKYVSYDRCTGLYTTRYSSGKVMKIQVDELGRVIKASDGSCTHEFFYDADGRLVKSDSNGVPVFYAYNARGLVSEIRVRSISTFYEYDQIGRVRSVSSGGMTRTFSYYPQEHKKVCEDSNGFCTVYEYDTKDRLLNIYQRDTEGTLRTAMGLIYDGKDHCIAKITFDSGRLIVEAYEFDERNRLSCVKSTNSNVYSDFLRKELYGSDVTVEDSLLVHSITKSDAAVLERLRTMGLSEYDTYYDWTEYYEYDSNGNMVSKKTPLGILSYTYNKLNQLVSCAYNGTLCVSFSYDANGNMIEKKSLYKTETFVYNEENRLSEYSSFDAQKKEREFITYMYDCLGRMSSKCRNGETVEFIYDGLSFTLLAELTTSTSSESIRYRHISDGYKVSSAACFAWCDGDLVFENRDDGVTYSFITDQKGTVCSVADYVLSDATGVQYHVSGMPVSDAKFAYCGKRYDAMTGLYDYGYRHYSPLLSRFTTEDPARDGFNWYTYCAGNPVDFEDDAGLKNIARRNTKLMQDYDGETPPATRYCAALGNHVNSYFRLSGCYLNLTTDVVNTFANMDYDMTYLNTYENFGKTRADADCLIWRDIIARYNIDYDTYGVVSKKNDSINSFSDYINMHENEDRECILAVQVYYNGNGKHWVTVEGGVVQIDGIAYVKIQATSNYDLASKVSGHTGRTAHGWLAKDGDVYVPVSKICDARAFYKAK